MNPNTTFILDLEFSEFFPDSFDWDKIYILPQPPSSSPNCAFAPAIVSVVLYSTFMSTCLYTSP